MRDIVVHPNVAMDVIDRHECYDLTREGEQMEVDEKILRAER